MVEQGIYFALGCIITALAAMMFAPIFWSRALRLTRKRLQLQVPLSMQEILAERDQLRAEFAVERLRIEQAAEKVHTTKAADMAEIGRRSMEINALRDRITALLSQGDDHSRLYAELTREAAQTAAEVGTLQKALDDAEADVEKWRGRAYQAADEGDRLRNDIEGHRATIAGLNTRSMGLEMRLTDTERSNTSHADGLRAKLEAAMGHATRHEASAIDLRRECDDAKARIRGLEEELGASRERERRLQLQTSMRFAQTSRAVVASTDEGSDADLRSSIHALGLAVAMMSRRNGLGASEEDVTAPRQDAPSPVEG